MPDDRLAELGQMMSRAREIQKANDTAFGMVDALLVFLKNIGRDAHLDFSEIDPGRCRLSISFDLLGIPAAVKGGARDHTPCADEASDGGSSSGGARVKARRWTKQEIDRLKARYQAGRAVDEIADELGRPLYGTRKKLTRLIAEGKIVSRGGSPPANEEVAEVPPAASAAPHPADCTTPMAAEAVPDRPAPSVRQVDARLDKLGYEGCWDADLDLEMVELLLGGMRADGAAEILEIPRKEIIRRFKDLLPEPGIEAQQRLLEALRRRSGRKWENVA